ncbi:hypothetical protein CEP52_016298 [Fusarium oligoseptatum]|uniref:Quinate permease n=1 Tax=Fusarium oligoseptatum TaxID=2604345 RepID=A0A428S532_9HYPO|nr:hypothetical protein CEP52_016298 [Fusarium oligoseptatum]
MFVVAGLKGFGLADSTSATKGATAALFIWEFALSVGWSSCVWIVTAEVASLQLREKTITIATFFCLFMQDKGYTGLEGRIGFIYGGFSFITTVWAFFELPETGFHTLEELDELFQNKVPTRQFKKHVTIGISAELAEAELGKGAKEILAEKEVA